MKDNYYCVLGVNPSASAHSIQAAYRQLAKACNPDHAGASATEKFQILQEAYEVLSDPDKREAYDSQCRQEEDRPARYHIVPEPLVPALLRGLSIRSRWFKSVPLPNSFRTGLRRIAVRPSAWARMGYLFALRCAR